MSDPATLEAGPATSRQVLRILIANQSNDSLCALASVVAGLGHLVISRTVDVGCAAALAACEQPDVALVCRGSRDDHALDLIDEIVRERACPVIVITSAEDAGFALIAASHGVFAVLRMSDPAGWQAVIGIALRRFADMDRLQRAFERRATIERAKGILMERHSIAADTAFSMLRAHARNRNLKVVDVATAVVTGTGLLPAGPLARDPFRASEAASLPCRICPEGPADSLCAARR